MCISTHLLPHHQPAPAAVAAAAATSCRQPSTSPPDVAVRQQPGRFRSRRLPLLLLLLLAPPLGPPPCCPAIPASHSLALPPQSPAGAAGQPLAHPPADHRSVCGLAGCCCSSLRRWAHLPPASHLMVPCVGCWWGWLGSEPNAGASTAYLDGTPNGDGDGIGVAAATAAFYAAVSSDDDDDTDGTNGGDTQALRRRFSLIAKVCSPHTPPTAPPMLPHRPDHTLFGFVCSCTSSRVQRPRRLKDTRTLSLSLSRCCLCMYLHPLCCVALPHPSPASLIRNCRNTNGKPCARTSRAGCGRRLRCGPSWHWLRGHGPASAGSRTGRTACTRCRSWP